MADRISGEALRRLVEDSEVNSPLHRGIFSSGAAYRELCALGPVLARELLAARKRIAELEEEVQDLKLEVEAADGARREDGYRCD